jgi:hypothetical protein
MIGYQTLPLGAQLFGILMLFCFQGTLLPSLQDFAAA